MTPAADFSLRRDRLEPPPGSQDGAADFSAFLSRSSRDRGKNAAMGRRLAAREAPRHEVFLTSYGQLQIGDKFLNMPPTFPIVIPLSNEPWVPQGLLNNRNEWPQMILANREGMTLSELYATRRDFNDRFLSHKQLRTEVEQFIQAFPHAGFAIQPNADDPVISFQPPAPTPFVPGREPVR